VNVILDVMDVLVQKVITVLNVWHIHLRTQKVTVIVRLTTLDLAVRNTLGLAILAV